MAKATTTKKKAAPKAAKEKKVKTAAVAMSFNRQILLRPITSEKTVSRESRGVYTFLVKPTATKVDVKFAVKEAYGVMPVKVNMVLTDGKTVRAGKAFGKRGGTKKAIVTLPKDARISIHEGV